MAVYVSVELKDVGSLMEAIQYVVDREGEPITKETAEYLQETLSRVQRHIDNEHYGDAAATEITRVLDFLGGGNSWTKEESWRSWKR